MPAQAVLLPDCLIHDIAAFLIKVLSRNFSINKDDQQKGVWMNKKVEPSGYIKRVYIKWMQLEIGLSKKT